MLFKVEMTVNIPLGFPAAEADEIKQREKTYSQQLQRLMGLPLYPFMDIRVEALCRHPSSVREDDS